MTRRHDDDDGLRSASAVVLGALSLVLPLLVGRMDVPTMVIASAVGGITVLPVWRHVGKSLTSPRSVVAYVGFVIGLCVVGWLFSALAIWTFIGAWVVTLSAMRLATGWRDTE